jgi:hypothetical protein
VDNRGNPEIYGMSIFPMTSRSRLLTSAAAMAVTILALMLLRIGVRRDRARRWQLKSLKASDQNAASASTSPIETCLQQRPPLQLRPRRPRPPPLDALQEVLRAMTLELPGLDPGSVQDCGQLDRVAPILELFFRTPRPS